MRLCHQFALLVLARLAFAQSQEITTKEGPVTFQSKVDLVLVPVVVRDTNGEPVDNLHRQDFPLKSAQDPPAGGETLEMPREIVGVWKGAVSTYQTEIPLIVRVQESGDIHIELGNQLKTLLDNASFRGGHLRGSFAGRLGISDTVRRP